MTDDYLHGLDINQLKLLCIKLNTAYINTTAELNEVRATYTRYLYIQPKPRWWTRLWFWLCYKEEEV